MLFRAFLNCTALILALLCCLNANAAPACEAAPCPAERPSKPLDIMKLMREQAASTRKADKPEHAASPVTQARKRAAAAAKPKAIPSEAATSFAAQSAPVPEVEVVTEMEFNAIDRAGEAAPPETVGAAPPLQVDDASVSSIVTKGQQHAPIAAAPQPEIASPSGQQASQQVSWMQWIWSAVHDTFAALTAAVHHLIG
jgi:hypothetical protein